MGRARSLYNRFSQGWPLLAGFAALIVATGGGSWIAAERLEAMELRAPRSSLIDLNTLLAASAGLEESRSLGAGLDIVFLGDSSAFGTTFGAESSPTSVPSWLQIGLERRLGPATRLHSFAVPGLDSFGYATLVDRILAGAPDLALVGVNLAWFSTGWRDRVRRPEFAALMPLSSLPWFFSLPGGWSPITLDVALRNWALVRFDRLAQWERIERTRQQVVAARSRLEDRLYGIADGESRAGPERALRRTLQLRNRRLRHRPDRRFNALGYSRPYGPALSGLAADHPAMVALAASIERFSRAGVDVIAYAIPINAQHMQKLGVLPAPGFDRSLATLTTVVAASRGRFVDLHAALPPRAFRDARGHLTYEGRGSGTAELAQQLATLASAWVSPSN